MKPEEFEQQLRSQPLRPVPQAWRAEILRAAERAAPVHESTPAARHLPGWREWFWPCPPAWAGVAATWLLILVLNLTGRSAPGSATQKSAPLTPQLVKLVIEERRLLTELLNPAVPDVAQPPRSPGMAPRSERRFGFIVV